MMANFERFSKEIRFQDFSESVQFCDLCPRLRGRIKVLSGANGNINSKVLFVAEAPGRLGADRTGVPLFGDRTGDNFEILLGNIGWKREDVFITNAVLCNPRNEDGNNGTPTIEEIGNCSSYLEMAIALLQPEVVVTLGTTALKALDLISPHGVQLREAVAKPVPWGGLKLFPLYHPGPRATVHRSIAKQRSDFMLLAKLVDPMKGLGGRRKPRRTPAGILEEGRAELQQVARALIGFCGRMPYFKLTKLMYLVDLQAIRNLGRTVGSEVYLRQTDGPWPPTLNEALRAMEGFEIRRDYVRQISMVDIGPSPRSEVRLQDEILEIVAEVSEKYGRMTNSAIKTAVYSTEPMRHILKQEGKGKDMRNKPVLYKDKTVLDLQ